MNKAIMKTLSDKQWEVTDAEIVQQVLHGKKAA